MRLPLSLVLILAACGGRVAEPKEPIPEAHGAPVPASVGCRPTGCSGQVCDEVGADVVTTCEFRPEYGCYRTARCERQTSGACGWTETPELLGCLASPPSE
jgi:hypothetical protein